MKNIPNENRPRERLINYGINNLTNIDLLSIILNSGNHNKNVIKLSEEILNILENNLNITLEELLKIKGIGIAKASQIISIIELSKRLKNLNNLKNNKLIFNNSRIIYESIKKEVENLTQENLYVLYLDSKLKLIKKELLYKGTINQVLIHPRDIFKYAVKFSAVKIILIHNHPSGDPSPSNNDIILTNNIYECSKIMQIELLDHLIIGFNKYYSFKDNNKLN